MKKVLIVFGSSTGTCEDLAGRIAQSLGIDESNVCNVSSLTKEQIEEQEVLILGSSTWGCGELQDDWAEGIKLFQEADLNGKTVAIFGCGDSESFGDTFCDAMELIREALQDKGCRFIGNAVSTEGYTYGSSLSVNAEGHFIGLALDEVNQPDMTDERIAQWCDTIRPELA